MKPGQIVDQFQIVVLIFVTVTLMTGYHWPDKRPGPYRPSFIIKTALRIYHKTTLHISLEYLIFNIRPH